MARKQDEFVREIISKLDIVAEYRALGVDVATGEPDEEGWIPCHAFGREDRNPSAGDLRCRWYVNRITARRRGEFDAVGFAAEKASRFTDWKAAKSVLRRESGRQLPGRKKFGPFDHLEPLPWSDDLVGLW